MIGLLLGPLSFLLTIFIIRPEGLSTNALIVLATTLWVAIWWISESIPISATALLPIVIFPLSGAMKLEDTTAAFANPMIFLFMGGFMIAVTIEKWGLHKRIALNIISRVGSDLRKIILGFMLATSFLSMWISNTATAVMMMPIALAVAHQLGVGLTNGGKTEQHFGKALMLSIAYSCSIGGIATLIGTPTNMIFVGVAKELYKIEISFMDWMMIGLPVSTLLLITGWIYLVYIGFRIPKGTSISGGRNEIRQQLIDLGPMSAEEKKVTAIFSLVALAWITRSFVLQKLSPGIDDTVIAIAGALALFITPSKNKLGDYLLDWRTAENIPWGILILFGGGLAIAAGFKETGLATWLGNQMTMLQALPYIIILLALVALVDFLTEMTSNVATASILMPVLAALALSMNVHPFGFMLAATIAASCAFMLPVGTPPNAVVFSSGYLKISDMVRIGFWMNIISIIIITLLAYYLLPIIWDFDLSVFPAEFLTGK